MPAPSARPPRPSEHWLDGERVRVYPRILLVMFTLAALLYALTFEDGLDGRGRPLGTDFLAFWSAARVTVEGSAVDPWSLPQLQAFQLAQFPGLSGPTPWVYPPTMLLLIWPLGHLAYAPAFVAWTAFGLACFLGCLRAVIGRRRGAWPLVLAFPGLWLGVAHGQTQFVVAALMGGALLLLEKRPALAGIAVGLLAIKPHLAILFPLVLIASGQWRAFVSAALTAVAAFGAAVLAFGTGSIRAWLDGMSLVGSAIDAGALPVYKFVTPYTSMRLLGVPEVPALVLHVCVALPVAWWVWHLWRTTDDMRIRASSLVVGTFIVSPYAADYDLAVLAFPIAWMALLGLDHGWVRGDRPLLLAAWILSSLTAPIAAVSHICVTPLVLGLMLRQLWLRASTAPHDLGAQSAQAPPAGAT